MPFTRLRKFPRKHHLLSPRARCDQAHVLLTLLNDGRLSDDTRLYLNKAKHNESGRWVTQTTTSASKHDDHHHPEKFWDCHSQQEVLPIWNSEDDDLWPNSWLVFWLRLFVVWIYFWAKKFPLRHPDPRDWPAPPLSSSPSPLCIRGIVELPVSGNISVSYDLCPIIVGKCDLLQQHFFFFHELHISGLCHVMKGGKQARYRYERKNIL